MEFKAAQNFGLFERKGWIAACWDGVEVDHSVFNQKIHETLLQIRDLEEAQRIHAQIYMRQTDETRAATEMSIADLRKQLTEKDRLKDEAVQKGRDLCQGFGNLLLAVLRMNKHMADYHELSTCCTGVTPSPAHDLLEAYNALAPLVKEQESQKRKGPIMHVPGCAGGECSCKPVFGGRE